MVKLVTDRRLVSEEPGQPGSAFRGLSVSAGRFMWDGGHEPRVHRLLCGGYLSKNEVERRSGPSNN